MLRKALRKDLLLNARHLWASCVVPLGRVRDARARRRTHHRCRRRVRRSLMAATMGAREDKLRTTATLASLPVSRRTLVAARYVVAYAVGLATYLAVVLMAAALPWSVQRAADLVDTRTLLLTLTLASGAIAALMPVVVRYGCSASSCSWRLPGAGHRRDGGVRVLRVAVGIGVFTAIEHGIVALHGGLDRPR